MKLTDAQRSHIIRRTAAALGYLQEGEDAVSVLSRIYCENLPDKSPRQGDLMARQVLKWIRQFRGAMEQARQDPSGYVRHSLGDMLSEMPLEDQCRILLNQLTEKNSSDNLQETESDRDRLLEKTVLEIIEEGVQPAEAAETLEQSCQDYADASEPVGADMLQAITAMLLYTMVKNGELTGLPSDITLGQMAMGVCCADIQRETEYAYRSGFMRRSEFQKYMAALRAVLPVLMIWAALAVAGLRSAVSVLSPIPYTALGQQLLDWMHTVQSFVYHCFAKMVRVEPETIARVELDLAPEEVQDEPTAVNTAAEQKTHWQKAARKQHTKKKKYLHQE